MKIQANIYELFRLFMLYLPDTSGLHELFCMAAR